jgi:hypothetical protein
VIWELTGDLLKEVFDGDDLDEGGVGNGCLDWAHLDSIPPKAAAFDAGAARASAEINRRTTRWEGEGCGGRSSRQQWGMLARKEAHRSSGSRSLPPLRTDVNMASSNSAVEGWPHRGCYTPVTGARTSDPAVGRGRGGGE